MARCEGIRLSWHIGISGAQYPEAATAEADCVGCV